MNRLRKNDPNYDATPEPAADPAFDLRRGLLALLLFFGILIGLSLICAWLR